MSRIKRPSPATIISLLALVVASSGTAIAASGTVNGDTVIKKDTLSGNRLRNHTLTGSEINLAKLGTVPHAARADRATNATSAGNAGHAATADSATNAGHAVTAGTATNAGHATTADTATTAAGLAPLKWIPLSLINGWQPWSAGNPPAVALDAQGIVHLRGSLYGSTGTAFMLPPQLRPSALIYLTADTLNATTGRIFLDSTGAVLVQDGLSSPGAAKQFTSLDGLTYPLN